jgi:hypothetical protein
LVDSEHSIETRCYSYLPESCKQAYQSHPASSLAKRGSRVIPSITAAAAAV